MRTAKKTKAKTMPKWRPAPDELIRLFDKAMQPLPEARVRKMFGYPASFINGQMFAGLFQDDMVLRLSSDDRASFLQHRGARPFEPMPGRAMREYVVVPPSILKSEAQLKTWLDRTKPAASHAA